MDLPIKIVIGGLGVRGYEVYASYAKRNPDKMQVTAIKVKAPMVSGVAQRRSVVVSIVNLQSSMKSCNGAMIADICSRKKGFYISLHETYPPLRLFEPHLSYGN